MASVNLGTKAVGSIVKIKVNGASKDFIIVQQGNPSTSVYDSSCDGTWLLMKDNYNYKAWTATEKKRLQEFRYQLLPERHVL